MNRTLFALFLVLAGCGQPLHLGYDYGRAYTSAFDTQADLSRPSVATMQYPLYGVEAQAIRLKVSATTAGGGGGGSATGGEGGTQ